MMETDKLSKLFYACGFGSIDYKIAENLKSIVEWQQVLQQVDIKGVEPMFNTLGEDLQYIKNKDAVLQEQVDVLSNAPEKEGNFFLVPKVVK